METDGSNALDIANLGTQPIEESGEYEGASEFYRPPEPGKESIILAEAPTDDKFYPIKSFDTGEILPGFAFNGHWKIVGGAQDGVEFYAMIDTRKKANRNGDDVNDYVRALKAAGQDVKYGTYGDLKQAVQNYFAAVPAKIGWKGDKCDCGAKALKMKDFALKADGKRDHVATCSCGEKVGARAKINAIFIETR